MQQEIILKITTYNIAETSYAFVSPVKETSSIHITCLQEVDMKKITLPRTNFIHYYDCNQLIVVRWSDDVYLSTNEKIFLSSEKCHFETPGGVSSHTRITCMYPKTKLLAYFKDLRLCRGTIMLNLCINDNISFSVLSLHNMRDGSVKKRASVLKYTMGSLISQIASREKSFIILGGGDFNINAHSITNAVVGNTADMTFHLDENTVPTYKYIPHTNERIVKTGNFRHTNPIDHTFIAYNCKNSNVPNFRISYLHHEVQNPNSIKLSDHIHVTSYYKLSILNR